MITKNVAVVTSVSVTTLAFRLYFISLFDWKWCVYFLIIINYYNV